MKLLSFNRLSGKILGNSLTKMGIYGIGKSNDEAQAAAPWGGLAVGTAIVGNVEEVLAEALSDPACGEEAEEEGDER